MVTLVIICCIMAGINVVLSIVEFLPFYDAIEMEIENTITVLDKLTLLFRMISHLPKLIPSIIDLGSIALMGVFFGIGSGSLTSTMMGLFCSNIISIGIYFKRRKKPNENPRVALQH